MSRIASEMSAKVFVMPSSFASLREARRGNTSSHPASSKERAMTAMRTAMMGLMLIAAPAPAPATAKTPEQTAEAALRAAPVWDGHNDVPEQLRERRKNLIGTFDFNDTRATADPANDRVAMQTD